MGINKPLKNRAMPALLEPLSVTNINARVEMLTDLVFELVEKKIEAADGDTDVVVANARKKRTAAHQRRKFLIEAAEVAHAKSLEDERLRRQEIVAAAFRDGLRPQIQGARLEWDAIITRDTDAGPIQFALSEAIIRRDSEFEVDFETTRARLIERYAGSGYTFTVLTDDKRGATKVPVVFVPA